MSFAEFSQFVAVGIVPFLLCIATAYSMGRCDGIRAERRRRSRMAATPLGTRRSGDRTIIPAL